MFDILARIFGHFFWDQQLLIDTFCIVQSIYRHAKVCVWSTWDNKTNN